MGGNALEPKLRHTSSYGLGKLRHFVWSKEVEDGFPNRKLIVDYLTSEGIDTEIDGDILFLKYGHKKYKYYWTTGRWGVFNWNNGKQPHKYYWSKGAKDLVERFIKKEKIK